MAEEANSLLVWDAEKGWQDQRQTRRPSNVGPGMTNAEKREVWDLASGDGVLGLPH